MKNLLKSLLVWLMFAAIPFQGFAAASMLACSPTVAVAVQAAPAAHKHCDDMTMADAAPQASKHDTPSHHHSAGKCNTCASCCFGAVMAPPAPCLQVPGDMPQVATIPAANGPVATVDLALPERPPKPSLT